MGAEKTLRRFYVLPHTNPNLRLIQNISFIVRSKEVDDGLIGPDEKDWTSYCSQ